jgi:hypothetical protein
MKNKIQRVTLIPKEEMTKSAAFVVCFSLLPFESENITILLIKEGRNSNLFEAIINGNG